MALPRYACSRLIGTWSILVVVCGHSAAVAQRVPATAATLISRMLDSLQLRVRQQAKGGRDSDSWLALARVHEAVGSLDSAHSLLRASFGRSIATDSLVCAGAWRFRAPPRLAELIAQDSNDRSNKLKTDEVVVALCPKSADAWSQLGFSRGQGGNLGAALEAHDRAIAVGGGLLKYRLRKGRTIERLGTYSETLEYYNSVLRLDATPADDVLWAIGDLHRANGQRSDAAAAYRSAFLYYPPTINSFSPWLGADSAAVLVRERYGPAAALEAVTKAFASDTSDTFLLGTVGDLYSLDSNYAAALPYYRASVASLPSAASLWKVAGTLFSLERFEESLRAYRDVIAQDSEYVGALYNMGAALDNLDRITEAQRQYAEYVLRQPDDADGWLRLGWTTSRIRGKDREAVAFYEKALMIEPGAFDDNPYFRASWEAAVARAGEQPPGTVALVRQSIVGSNRSVARRPNPTDSEGNSVGSAQRAGPTGAKTRTGAGSGFVVGSRGEVLTNAHVVEGCGSLRLGVAGSPSVTASVIATDVANDLAVLLTSTRVGPGLPLRRTAPRAGMPIVILGFPLAGVLSQQPVNATGTISALAGIGNDSRMLQISAPVQVGNSGGPVIDADGAVIGVVVSKLDAVRAYRVTGDIPQNVNFAIKATVALAFLESSGVTSLVAAPGRVRSVPELVEMARGSTVLVECFK